MSTEKIVLIYLVLTFVVPGVLLFLINIYKWYVFPYFKTRDMSDDEKEKWLLDYEESLPDDEE